MNRWRKLHKKIDLAVSFVTVFSFCLLIFMNTAVLIFPFAQGVAAILITVCCFSMAGFIANVCYKKLDKFIHIKIYRSPH